MIYLPVLERFGNRTWNSALTLFLGGLIFGGNFVLVSRGAYIWEGYIRGEFIFRILRYVSISTRCVYTTSFHSIKLPSTWNRSIKALNILERFVNLQYARYKLILENGLYQNDISTCTDRMFEVKLFILFPYLIVAPSLFLVFLLQQFR